MILISFSVKNEFEQNSQQKLFIIVIINLIKFFRIFFIQKCNNIRQDQEASFLLFPYDRLYRDFLIKLAHEFCYKNC